MKWKAIENIADPGSLIVESKKLNPSIVKVYFTINGSHISGQFDPDNVGVYGFDFEGSELLKLLCRDENGHPITTTGVNENDS